MVKNIKKVAVLGSGIMGSGIACHLANIGLEVLLLDMISKDAATSNDKTVRNGLVNASLKNAIKSKPSPVFTNSVVKNIKTGNFTDNFEEIKDYDWIIEVVVERLDIKKEIFKKIVKEYEKIIGFLLYYNAKKNIKDISITKSL